jgi:hypothetical protein
MPYSPTKERGLDVARNTNPYPVASEYTKKSESPDVLLRWHFRRRRKRYEKLKEGKEFITFALESKDSRTVSGEKPS